MVVNLKSLIAKANDITREALESAAKLCVYRTHYDIEIEHFLMSLLDTENSDLQRILNNFRVDKSQLTTE